MLHKDDFTERHVPHIIKQGPTGVPVGILEETVASKAFPPLKATLPMMHLIPPKFHHSTLRGSGLKSDHGHDPS